LNKDYYPIILLEIPLASIAICHSKNSLNTLIKVFQWLPMLHSCTSIVHTHISIHLTYSSPCIYFHIPYCKCRVNAKPIYPNLILTVDPSLHVSGLIVLQSLCTLTSIGAFLKGMHILMILKKIEGFFFKKFNHSHPNLEDEKWRNYSASRFRIPLNRELYVKVSLSGKRTYIRSHLAFHFSSI